MARILITSSTLPVDPSDGRRLRLHHFCRQLAARHDCYLAVIGDDGPGEDGPAGDPRTELGIRACRRLDPVPSGKRSSRRLFRLSNARYLEFSHPAYLAEVRRDLTAMCLEWQIDVIACLTIDTAEIVMPLAPPKLLDFCDSGSLTVERMLANRRGELTPLERAKLMLRRLRARQTEAAYLAAFDHTTTISSSDRDAMLQSSGVSPDRVSVVPNGVARAALEAGAADEERLRSVVFWGHMDFPPNWTAIKYFHDDIFIPLLAPEGIEWHIYGSGADERLGRMREHPLIHVHGFVDSLYGEIVRHGVMVNPMVEGAGLKNKVLEAFACRIPVVSTSLGIEATGAVKKFHYLPGDSPQEFAHSVLELLDNEPLADELRGNARRYVETNFAWDAIGEELADRVLDCRNQDRIAVAQ